MLEIKGFFDKDTATVTYLAWDMAAKKAAIIDPVLDFDPASGATRTTSVDAVLDAAAAQDLDIVYALETHAHADHLSAAQIIREKTGAKTGIGARIVDIQKTFKPIFNARDVAPDGGVFDLLLNDGDEFELGEQMVKVMHTPGHTPACVTYVIGDAAFVGDTLFMPDYGTARTDFPGGDAATLYTSIQRILSLPDETRIFVGHDYPPETRGKPAWETTVAEQKRENKHINDSVDEASFVDMRETRDKKLSAPRLILPSLQVNIRAGTMPPPEDDGHVYLKLPVNRL